jgi:hypothetical protein
MRIIARRAVARWRGPWPIGRGAGERRREIHPGFTAASGVKTMTRRRDDGLIGRRDLAKKFGVTPRRITLWASDGMPVAKGGGPGREARYKLADVLAWREQRKANDNSASSVSQERAKLFDVQRRRAEIEIRRREGELLDRVDVERVWTERITQAKGRAREIPRAVAGAIVTAVLAGGGEGAVQKILLAAIDDALRELGGGT